MGVIRGGLAGLLATVVMTAVLFAAKALGLLYEEPPKEITKHAEQAAGAHPHRMSEEAFTASWLVAHTAYGAGCGVVFSVTRRFLPGPPVVRGVAYGLMVWAVSYLGFLPALGLYPSVEEDRDSRVAVMIAAHVVYGAALGKADPPRR